MIFKHIFIVLMVLLLFQALPAFSQEADDLLTCGDLVGLTYSVRVPIYGNVCYEFISSDMYTQTYETIGSFDGLYNILSQVPCVIQMGVFGLNAACQVQFSENGEFLYGYGVASGFPQSISFPMSGHRVHQPECVPGRLLSDLQDSD